MPKKAKEKLSVSLSKIEKYDNCYREYLVDFSNNDGKSEEILEKIILAEPTKEKDYHIKLEAFIDLRIYKEALGFLETNKSQFGQEHQFSIKSKIFYLKGENKKSLAILKEAIDEYPKSIKLLNNYAFLLDESKRYSEALSIYKKALKINPNSVQTLNNLAVTKWHMKESPVEELEKVTELAPTCSEAHLNLGIALADSMKESPDKYNEAIQSFNEAIRLDKECWRAHHQKGKAYWCLGEFELALACFEESKKTKAYFSKGSRVGLHKEFKDFSDIDVEVMTTTIFNKNITLGNLDLSFNEIRGKKLDSLISSLPLVALDLSHNKIEDKYIPNIVGNATLVDLNLSYNFLSDKGIEEILKNKTLINLNIDGIKLTKATVRKLHAHLEENKDQLGFFSDAVQNNDFQEVKEILKENQVSPFASLQGNATALETALLNKNQALTQVLIRGYLEYYSPRLSICKHIGNLLKKYPDVLEGLDLHNLALRDNELIYLLEDFIKNSKKLKILDISENLIEKQGFVSLALILKENPRLNLKNKNKIPGDDDNRAEMTINLKNNKIMVFKTQFEEITKNIDAEKVLIDLSLNCFDKETAGLFDANGQHGFFSSQRFAAAKIRSIVNPKEFITNDTWMVHLLGKKGLRFSGDHAMIIIEWINNRGHLTILTAELFVSDDVGKLSLKTCDNIKNLEIRLADYNSIIYRRSKAMVKPLISHLREEKLEDRKYPYALFGNKLGNTDNCLTWAVDRLFDNDIIDDNEKNRILPLPSIAIPSRAVKAR